MKYVEIEIGDHTLYLMYNGAAMFALNELHTKITTDENGQSREEIKNILEAIAPSTKAGFYALCEAAAIMAEQGELYRRYMGYDKGKIIKKEELLCTMSPLDTMKLKTAVMKAVANGIKMESPQDENEERDLVLEELNKKKIK